MTIPEKALTKILTAAVQAPSGDNSQPWRFKVRGNIIQLWNVPEKDTSPFNYHQVSNYIALGAALENLIIASQSEGFSTDVRLFPDAAQPTMVAEITLTAGSIKNDLFEYIQKRASNRQSYKPLSIPEDTLQELREVDPSFGCTVTFVTEKESVGRMAYAVSAGEKIALENREIHDFLFEHVTWDQQEESKRHGFYIKTFEFKPPQEFVFKLFRNWNILSFFQKFGVTDFIAKDMESIYRSSAAFGAIIIQNQTKEDFIAAGRTLEQLWLKATRAALSMQATTSVHLLNLPIQDGASSLIPAHQDLIKERQKILTKEFNLMPEQTIAFAFRIGIADAPSGRTTRATPIVEILEK